MLTEPAMARSPLRVAGSTDPGPVDLVAAERAAGDFLHALGIATDSESLRGTPRRMARVVGHFAARPQVQERLTAQIAGWLDGKLKPAGVGVVIEAEHMCMTIRGIRAHGSTTVTSTLLGALRDDARSRQELFALARDRS
jgi:GTP cyclohydrolase I